MSRRIGRSKSPLLHQLPIITENLSQLIQTSVHVHISCWSHTHVKGPEKPTYEISFVPSGHSAAEIEYFSTWEDLLNFYFKKMKESN